MGAFRFSEGINGYQSLSPPVVQQESQTAPNDASFLQPCELMLLAKPASRVSAVSVYKHSSNFEQYSKDTKKHRRFA